MCQQPPDGALCVRHYMVSTQSLKASMQEPDGCLGCHPQPMGCLTCSDSPGSAMQEQQRGSSGVCSIDDYLIRGCQDGDASLRV
jgi:hypothetical protein